MIKLLRDKIRALFQKWEDDARDAAIEAAIDMVQYDFDLKVEEVTYSYPLDIRFGDLCAYGKYEPQMLIYIGALPLSPGRPYGSDEYMHLFLSEDGQRDVFHSVLISGLRAGDYRVIARVQDSEG